MAKSMASMRRENLTIEECELLAELVDRWQTGRLTYEQPVTKDGVEKTVLNQQLLHLREAGLVGYHEPSMRVVFSPDTISFVDGWNRAQNV